MKQTKAVRKIDELGRIVLPLELRERLGCEAGDSMEVYARQDRIILRRYRRVCALCGEQDESLLEDCGRICLCKACLKRKLEGEGEEGTPAGEE